MNRPITLACLAALFFLALTGGSHAAGFFRIHDVEFISNPPRDGIGIWQMKFKSEKSKTMQLVHARCLKVTVSTEQNTLPAEARIRIHFLDEANKLIRSESTAAAPSKMVNGKLVTRKALPALFVAQKPETIFFTLPYGMEDRKWTAVVVFCNKDEGTAITYPPKKDVALLSFPEKDLVNRVSTQPPSVRKKVDNPLIENVVKINSEKMPQLTLFLRLPKNVEHFEDVKGVMAMSILANSLDDIRHQMQSPEMSGDHNGVIKFANENQLAILAWGARKLWNSSKNADELDLREAREEDRNFDIAANAWERGVQELHRTYGLPVKNYLLCGYSGAAQWAARLCLRKPQYFAAAHLHIASSYDKPTREAAGVLWCVTTGELEAGYERSLEFLHNSRELGYSMIYKAYPGMGHYGSPSVSRLGLGVFKFALASLASQAGAAGGLQAAQAGLIPAASGQSAAAKTGWPFFTPFCYADAIQHVLVPAVQNQTLDANPNPLIPLPNQEMADLWMKN